MARAPYKKRTVAALRRAPAFFTTTGNRGRAVLARPGKRGPAPTLHAERKRLVERVRDALNRLDEDSRAALMLRDLEELSAEQAGEILGISPTAVRQRAHRARVRLRDLLYR